MPAPKIPTRFDGGVTNVGPNDPWYMMGIPDPTKNHVFFDDFIDFDVTQWVVSTVEAGAGAPTLTTGTAADAGNLIVTTDNGAADAVYAQWSGVDQTNVNRTFMLTPGRQLSYKARLKLDNATLPDFTIGLMVLDTAPLATSGIGGMFRTTAGSAVVNFVVTNVTELVVAPVHTMVDDTFVELGYYFNGDYFEVFVDGVKKYTSPPVAFTPNVPITNTFGIRNSTAVARILTIDYILSGSPRNLY